MTCRLPVDRCLDAAYPVMSRPSLTCRRYAVWAWQRVGLSVGLARLVSQLRRTSRDRLPRCFCPGSSLNTIMLCTLNDAPCLVVPDSRSFSYGANDSICARLLNLNITHECCLLVPGDFHGCLHVDVHIPYLLSPLHLVPAKRTHHPHA